MADTFAILKRANVARSLTNPRTTFDAAYLAELGESIKTQGIISPLLVRPLPGYRVADTTRNITHEIVCGECRDRGCEIAGVDEYPVLIRDLTDDQVLVIQLIENLKRKDLSELEEAEGYERLMRHNEVSADELGALIDKSRSYVYGRLKLLDLSFECKQALRAGGIDASRALLIARIPDSGLQTTALVEAIRKNALGEVLSVRAFGAWLQTNVMLRLEHAVFKITDARLVTAAGSCTVCPKRTGANPDLFADVASADICTDPACFRSKEAAHRDALRVMAEKKGMRVIEGFEAEELLDDHQSNRVEGYSPLGQIRNDITVDGKTGLSMRELLGKDAPDPVLFEHPRTKELMELVPTDEAEGVLLAKGLLKADKTTATATEPAKLEKDLARLQTMVERDTARAVRNALVADTKRAILETDDAAGLLTSNLLRAWFHTQVDDGHYDHGDIAEALAYTYAEGEDEADAITQHIKACSHATLCRGMVILFVSEDDLHHYISDNEPLILNSLTDALAIDVKGITRKAIKGVNTKHADEAKAIQAKIDALKNPPLPLAPLAQPKLAPGKAKAGQKPTERKAKLSAEDAQSGIAAAMQEQDRAATAPPEGQQSDDGVPNCADDSFAVGKQVRITTDDNKLGLIARKHGGKTGTITRREEGGGYWDVTFKGRGGGVAMFAEDQMAVVLA